MTVLHLPGGPALSGFRLDKLNQRIRDAVGGPAVLAADHWHFVETDRPLADDEHRRLEEVLAHRGPVAAPASRVRTGATLLVTPRPGTVSPWSSKATDIVRQCGLEAVRRVERGTLFHLATGGDLRRVAPLLHDRMTEAVLDGLDEADTLFRRVTPRWLTAVDVIGRGREAILEANGALGLALTDEEVDYLVTSFLAAGRNPTDVELTMFAQANSEHCRHKIFNAAWEVDGEPQDLSLFGMVRTTHARHPQGTIVAYADNAAVMEGGLARRFFASPLTGRYGTHAEITHTVMKVETHNHPTAVSPFAGAATGAGGEIRDEGATGRGAKPKAGLCGFSVSHLRIPGCERPWEGPEQRPDRVASPLAIMIEGPLGAASFNNEFGRPNLAGYFRTYEQVVAGTRRGYHKPIMLAGGVGNIRAAHTAKAGVPPGALLIHLGGPGMLIGMGGGAASSMASGVNAADLDFDSVQRGNAEMQCRAQQVIDGCWALGDRNPILSIHDVGAGGLSNALPELVHAAGRGARIDLRAAPSEEPGMAPREVWSNEAQERYVLAIAPGRFAEFEALCQRERCPLAVVGEVTADERIEVRDPLFGNVPVDMELAVLFGRPPRMLRRVARRRPACRPLHFHGVSLADMIGRVLRAPTVADKTFLVTIGDRSVGGLCARDQCAGPWQVPVSDCAATLLDFDGCRGEAFAVGERAPLAAIDAPASGRMAVAEALTNLAAAPIVSLDRVKLSANWMASAGSPGEDAALFDTVRAVALDLCPALGVSIPVGKDSMSMRTAWTEGGVRREVVSPVSLVVSAFAPCGDVRGVWTPDLRRDAGDTLLVLIDLADGRTRLGASILAQVFDQTGDETPDLDDPSRLRALFAALADLRSAGLVLAYHDRSDGGCLVTLLEMAFAGRTGLTVDLDALPGAAGDAAAALFCEEPGAVIQVAAARLEEATGILRRHRLDARVVAWPEASDEVRIVSAGRTLFADARTALQRAWSETTWQLQALRDNPACAREEYDRILDTEDPGLHAAVTFDPAEDVAAPFIARGTRPAVAILREQGVNGHVEMAAAFDRAGFTAIDVHMSDVADGRVSLTTFRGLAACGGFSYGDVLGAGEGWARSILFNARAHDEFAAFFSRSDTFALGVCNGCQMMAALKDLVPGAVAWPRFVRNTSEQFEARLVMVEVLPSPSMLFAGMEGSRLPVVVSHGEGRTHWDDEAAASRAIAVMRFVDGRGAPAGAYPANPNGSPGGLTSFTTPDGRFTILMPHPERVFRSVQLSWSPRGWGEDSPWMRLFRNARTWVG